MRSMVGNNRRWRHASLVALLLLAVTVSSLPLRAAPSTGLVPLNELGTGQYKGEQGGLYPGGSNTIPAKHLELGHSMATEIVPRDVTGKPDKHGAIVFLSVGTTTTTLEFQWFQQKKTDTNRNGFVKVVDGSQIGMYADKISVSGFNQDRYWQVVNTRLKEAGCSPQQVQVVWLEDSDGAPKSNFPENARTLEQELVHVVQSIHQHLPFCQLCYVSSHMYAGYSHSQTCGEPYAYETGFAVKWLIEAQMKGDPELNCDPQQGTPRAPWLAWGPYLWADGSKGRKDGLSYQESDFRKEDGFDPGAGGMDKAASQLLSFLHENENAALWYSKDGIAAATDRIYSFDHSMFNDILTTYVQDGKVDYETLREQGKSKLQKYLDSLAEADPGKLATDTERLAFWLNAYNACSMMATVNGGKLDTRAARKAFFNDIHFQVGGHFMSLDDMEHEFMGPLFKQPKTHFGLVCSSMGCPVIKGHAYSGTNVTNSLDDNARAFINDPNRVHWDPDTKVLWLSPIFDWYKTDFERDGQTVLSFVMKYLPADVVAQIKDAQKTDDFRLKYMDYDWRVNDKNSVEIGKDATPATPGATPSGAPSPAPSTPPQTAPPAPGKKTPAKAGAT